MSIDVENKLTLKISWRPPSPSLPLRPVALRAPYQAAMARSLLSPQPPQPPGCARPCRCPPMPSFCCLFQYDLSCTAIMKEQESKKMPCRETKPQPTLKKCEKRQRLRCRSYTGLKPEKDLHHRSAKWWKPQQQTLEGYHRAAIGTSPEGHRRTFQYNFKTYVQLYYLFYTSIDVHVHRQVK